MKKKKTKNKKTKQKNQLFIYYRYFAVLYRSFVNILKQSHVTLKKNSHSNHYKIINSYKEKESLKFSQVNLINRCV